MDAHKVPALSYMPPDSGSGITPGQLWHMVRARWGTVARTVLLVVLVTGVVTVLTPKTYVAQVAMLIDFQSDQSVTGQRYSPHHASSYITTQVDLIKSRSVWVKVVDNLGLADDPEAREEFQSRREAQGTTERVSAWMVAQSGRADAVNPDATASDREPRKIYDNSPDTAGDSDPFREWLAARLSRGLDVQARSDSRLFDVRYRSKNPNEAARILNAVVQAYVDASLALSVDPAQERRTRYNEYLAGLRARVEEAQQRVNEAQQELGILNADQPDAVEIQQIGDLGARLSAVRAEREQAQTRLRRLRELRAQGGSSAAESEAAGSPHLRELQTRMMQLVMQRAELSQTLGPNHPRMVALESEIAAAREGMSGAIHQQIAHAERAVRSAEENEAALMALMQTERQNALAALEKGGTLGELRRELESARRVHENALANFNRVLGDSELQLPDIRVLNRAAPPDKAAWPSLRTNLALGLFVGFLVGLCMAVIRELGDRRVRCEEDVTRALQLPLLGRLTA